MMDSELHRERLRNFELLCREHGYSVTVQRRVIFDTVVRRGDHPTADAVFKDVKRRIPGVSRTTVYRVLEMLVELGAISKANTPGAATRFDPNTRRHHHLFCTRCEKIIDIEDQRVDRSVKVPDGRSHSFQIESFAVHFHGLCEECRHESKPAKGQTITNRRRPIQRRQGGRKVKTALKTRSSRGRRQ